MTGDQQRGVTAQDILSVRALRKRIFPSEIFDEHAWNMLLILFVGLTNNEVISEKVLIERSEASQGAGRRWIAHLVEDGQVAKRNDDDDVILTHEAIVRMREFLDTAIGIAKSDLAEDA